MGRLALAVIVPAYREAHTIGAIVRAARDHAEVIVVDDCSPDQTGARAYEEGAMVVRNPVNRGYDGALSAGFEAAVEAGFTHVVTLDADGEHDPAVIGQFRAALIDRSIPLVLGVRPRRQRFAETVMGLIIRGRLGARDILCGMKGYDLTLWRANRGFDHHESIGTELAINALKAGVGFEEINVSGTPRADRPRFDYRMRANIRILQALWYSLSNKDNPITQAHIKDRELP